MYNSNFYVTVVLLIVLFARVKSVELPFSGVYQSNTIFQPEKTVSAFLMSKHRFLTTAMSKQWNSGIETTSESIISTFLKSTCPACINIFSRDFLDFFTESLSGAITQLHPSQREVVNHYARGMKKNIKTLKKIAHTAHHRDCHSAANATLAILLFNGDMSNRVSGRMKLLLFQSTFWSVYRHFGSVLVMTKSSADRDAVQALKLPAAEVVNLDLHTNTSRKVDYYAKVEILQAELVRHSLQVTAQRWRSDATWARFAHVYFSLGDQLLHARRLSDIYRTMAVGAEGNIVAAPHTMQTLTLAQSLPSSLQALLWPEVNNTASVGALMSVAPSVRSSRTQSPQWLPNVRIHAENAETVTGSCCEDGRFIFPECGSDGSPNQLVVRSGDGGKVGDGAKLNNLYGEHGDARAHPAPKGDSHRAATVLYVVKSSSAPPWTTCPHWGPRNFSDWIAVGKAGFTMPTVTTGLAYCQYSAKPVQCALPSSKAKAEGGSNDDSSRMPRKVHDPNSGRSMIAVSPETPLVRVNKFALDQLSKENALRLLQTKESEAAGLQIVSTSPSPRPQKSSSPPRSSDFALAPPQRPVVPAAASALVSPAPQHQLPSGLHRRRGQRHTQDHFSSED